MKAALALHCHPQSRSGAVREIAARVERRSDALAVTYALGGDLARVRVPSEDSPSREPLWRHTCFELFVREAGAAAYHEINLSPSGQWAVYAFERYRHGGAADIAPFDPQVTVHVAPNRLELAAVVPLALLSPAYEGAALALALAAVIEARDGALSYWALAHSDGVPDFHDTSAFVLELRSP